MYAYSTTEFKLSFFREIYLYHIPGAAKALIQTSINFFRDHFYRSEFTLFIFHIDCFILLFFIPYKMYFIINLN